MATQEAGFRTRAGLPKKAFGYFLPDNLSNAGRPWRFFLLAFKGKDQETNRFSEFGPLFEAFRLVGCLACSPYGQLVGTS